MNNENHPSSRTALVGYGSETGTASDYAEELGRMLERLHFSTHVSNLDRIELSSLSSFTFILIITSTTGQGELPNNARAFWRSLLRRKLGPRYLEAVRFAAFGLGDTSYPQYNWAIRKVHKRLLQLGASEIYPRGEGDEQHDEGLDANFVPWVTDLRRVLLDKFPLPPDVLPISDEVLLTPKWLLTHESTSKEAIGANGITGGHHAVEGLPQYDPTVVNSEPFTVQLLENKRVTPDAHWQDVRHMLFKSDSQASYGPGDVLTIYPQNKEEDVNLLIERMGWEGIAEDIVGFIPTGSPSSSRPLSPPPIDLPTGHSVTFRRLLREYLDLTAIPRRSFFSLVAHFTKDEFHKDRLLEFTKPEYIDELYDYTTRPRRSILEVLQEFDSVKIPWQWAAHVLPGLRGRQFSIASGGHLKADSEGHASFELLVAIVKYKTIIKKIREGVCTRYISSLSPGAQFSVTLQKGGLGITRADALKPVVMIGPGTGVAPMRSLIWERLQWAEELKNAEHTGPDGHTEAFSPIRKTLLIYGCRNKNADYFFQDEWEFLKHQMPLEVYTAFSRDQATKVYVQDVVRQQGQEIFRLIHDLDGIVYVCGSSGKMPTAVRVALIDVFREHGSMNQADAEAFLEQMEKRGRYKQETWG